MRTIADNPSARWLPSRFQFATMRLIATIRLATAKPHASAKRLILAIDRGQSAFENHAVSVLLLAVTSAFVTAALQERVTLAGAMVVSVLISPWLLQIPVYLTGLALQGRNNQRLSGAILMSLVLGAAAWAFSRDSWVRYAGTFVLLLAAVNAFAALIMLALRPVVRRLESRCGLQSE